MADFLTTGKPISIDIEKSDSGYFVVEPCAPVFNTTGNDVSLFTIEKAEGLFRLFPLPIYDFSTYGKPFDTHSLINTTEEGYFVNNLPNAVFNSYGQPFRVYGMQEIDSGDDGRPLLFDDYVLDFTGSPITGEAPVYVSFLNLSSAYAVAEWVWDFGDGSTSSEEDPIHLFGFDGTFTVSLSAILSNGFQTQEKKKTFTFYDGGRVIGITKYFRKKQPAKGEELRNRVEVQTQPLLPATSVEQIFKTGEPITLAGGASTTITAYYSTQPALIDPPYNPHTYIIDNVDDTSYAGGEFEITSVSYYAWGAEITITNIDGIEGTGNVYIDGYPLRISGEETIVAYDDDSITSYGLRKYAYPKNHLVQSPEVAQSIADALLLSYKTYRKDVSVTWRGNPAMELGDFISVPEYQRGATVVNGAFKVTKNKLTYDGTLKQTTDGRKVIDGLVNS